jgi:hypothetical protein
MFAHCLHCAYINGHALHTAASTWETKMQVTFNGNMFTVTGTAAELQIVKDSAIRSTGSAEDGRLTGRVNKSERYALERMVEAANRPAAPRTNSARRVELFSVAQRDGLNHGKSWICSAYNCDAQGVDPSFEGQAVCYVYN